MIKIEIKSSFTGELIFTYEKEKNTTTETVIEFIRLELAAGKTRADLTRADLTSADLTSANLTNADLTRANLTRADLRGANLTNADLTRANLTRADLRGADLTSANLRGADLTSADLTSANLRGAKNKEVARIPMFCKWGHAVEGDKIHIGCEKRTIEEWDAFFISDTELSTKRGTDDFKQIEAIYLAYRAYLTHLKA